MRPWILLTAMVCGITFGASPANATVLMTLSSPSNLSALTVGQTAEIDLTLSGLPSPNTSDFIFYLDTRVLFPSTRFQLVSGPTATNASGSVFFASNQVADFNANSGPIPGGGGVTGNFVDMTSSGVGAIGQNGLYYSFLLRATSAGTGSIGFDTSNPAYNQYAAAETVPPFSFNPLPISGPLSFVITQAAVPEPSSVAMAALGLAIVGGWRRARRRPAG